MLRIAAHLGKGGPGKSTLSWILASFLSARRRVLAIDLDPQGTLTNALVEEQPRLGTNDVLMKTASVQEAAVKATAAYGDRLHVLTASSALSTLEQQTANDFDRHYRLLDVLKEAHGFDVVIMDTPPNAGYLTVSTLVAASHVLTPVSTEAAAFDQLPAFERLLEQLSRRLNPQLIWAGIVPTRYDNRRRLDTEVLEAIRENYTMVHPPIAESVRIKEGMARGTPANAAITAPFFTETVASILKAVGCE